MTKRMLIDASHAEETRVVVLDGNRLEDFDVETSTKRQLKGNIYLAKVVRVEPSLQAAFVEYGGNRHGFLAFSEIHPDYYQIPVADRQRLIEMEAEEARREEEEADAELGHAEAEAPMAAAVASEGPPAETFDAVGAPAAARNAAPSAAEASADTAAAAFAEPPAAVTGGETFDAAGAAVPTGGGRVEAAPLGAAAPPPTSESPAETFDEGGATGSAPATKAAAGPVMPAQAVAVAEAPAQPSAGSDQPSAEADQPSTGSDQLSPGSDHPPAASDQPEASIGMDAGAPPAAQEAPAGEPSSAAAAPSDGVHEPQAPPRGRRAQPMVIETETVRGPADDGDTAVAAAESDPDDGAQTSMAQADDAGGVDVLDREPGEDDGDTVEFGEVIPESPPPETIGGEPDAAEEQRERRIPPRFLRHYKIQEVIRRRQILLVQVVKEERGTKGAALTTYLSLAGRFCVLMPNSPRGGGISRKITSATDRRRLKEIINELDMPQGMGLIVRTAGAQRPKPEIKRDCEYLLRLWDDIREHTLKSIAPALIYEEASLIKRAIRDVYSRDIDEIHVDGEDGWRAAHDFMRMLMPSHAKKVQLWRDPGQPCFSRYGVEQQLENMLLPTAQLRSGGYLVINQAEALVAIDVNSGRSTRERGIEETALRTNLEAADEVARQLRLRDLAGLIVIDFIDMESKKHNGMVERRLKEALKNDRARIQVGHISHFGLLEMSRQRLRPSLAETSFIPCAHCGGTGHVRSTESAAIHVLRGIEEEGGKRRAAEIVVYVPTAIALYILNHKRPRLAEIEARYAMRVTITGDDAQLNPPFRIERLRAQIAGEVVAPVAMATSVAPPTEAPQPDMPQPGMRQPEFEPEAEEEPPPIIAEAEADDESEEDDDADDTGDEARADEAGGERGDRRRRRRRRRRGGGRREDGTAQPEREMTEEMPAEQPPIAASEAEEPAETHVEGVPEPVEPPGEDEAGGRRRGRRGGRRRRREYGEGDGAAYAAPGAEQPEIAPIYSGPTPANPFGGHAFDIFDVLEQAEAAAVSGGSMAAREATAAEPLSAPGVSVMSEAAEAADVAAVATVTPEATHAGDAPAPAEVRTMDAERPSGVDAVETVSLAGSAAPESAVEPEPAAVASLAATSGGTVASMQPEPAAGAAEAPVQTSIGSAGEPEVANAPVQAAEAEAAPAGAAALTVEPAAAPGEATATQDMATAAPVESPSVSNEAVSAPAIRPILVGGGDEPAAERKRGWWRR